VGEVVVVVVGVVVVDCCSWVSPCFFFFSSSSVLSSSLLSLRLFVLLVPRLLLRHPAELAIAQLSRRWALGRARAGRKGDRGT
jgi:hypothetical protein